MSVAVLVLIAIMLSGCRGKGGSTCPQRLGADRTDADDRPCKKGTP